MNCNKCNFPMVLHGDLPKSYHCPNCQVKVFDIKGHLEWFDVDGKPFTPAPIDDNIIDDIEKEINNWLKNKEEQI